MSQHPLRSPEDRRTRRHRISRLVSAWISLVPSKAVTLLVQIFAVPIVYRALGPVQFAAYAAVTSAVSTLGFLNLGMGGALVTPLTEAAACNDHELEARLFQATVVPLMLLSMVALGIVIPALALLPPPFLFGKAGGVASAHTLRWTAMLACAGTVISVPLSVLDNLRQAYQETHISNWAGVFTNSLLCAGLIGAAWFAPSLFCFVAVVVVSPVAIRLLNGAGLLSRRPYLLCIKDHRPSWTLIRRLGRDGISYMGAAAVANALIYQWPIYYTARVRPPFESSTFAVYIQLILLVISFGVSFAQPLWPALADAVARGDERWARRTLRLARAAALGYGCAAMVVLSSGTPTILRFWLHRTTHVGIFASVLAGAYVLLAIWEYVHWPLSLGLGAMRSASHLVLLRAVAFGALVPIAAPYGLEGVMVLLCASVIAITAWAYPRLLASQSRAVLAGRPNNPVQVVLIPVAQPVHSR